MTHQRLNLGKSYFAHMRARIVSDKRYRHLVLGYVALSLIGTYGIAALLSAQIHAQYAAYESVAINDRHGEVLTLYPNERGFYTGYAESIPPRVRELLLLKEDRYFTSHVGINVGATLRAMWRSLLGEPVGGASTITQQLVKNMLGKTEERTFVNKILESIYAVALSLTTSKERVLTMYSNTVYMGNQVAGLAQASRVYFNSDLASLSDTNIVQLLATLSSPSAQHPWNPKRNTPPASYLASRSGITFSTLATTTKPGSWTPPRSFELATMGVACEKTCVSTLDKKLTDTLRKILIENVERNTEARGTNGALVVIHTPSNEILAVVGSPYPTRNTNGYQYNMATEPRPVGSTIKPFIYTEAFTKGLRPYSLVDDREYRFTVDTGFPLYPKNYDGKYRGLVTLHAALSNSLNVPTVKVLEYVSLPHFYNFLGNTMQFEPLRDFDDYQYGIALGGLEMDPLSLAHLFTTFPNKGMLKPLTLLQEESAAGRASRFKTPMVHVTEPMAVFHEKYTQLTSAILSDRATGVEQFGLASNLHLSQSNVAVKTGTSRDFHDSWTVGYTPDFVVVAWLGNVENRPLKQITGASGAGALWHNTMEVLFQNELNTQTPFPKELIDTVNIDGKVELGLPHESTEEHRSLLLTGGLITSPQDGDTYTYQKGMSILLRASRVVTWHANEAHIGTGSTIRFKPSAPGTYRIRATDAGGGPDESVTLRVLP